MQARVRDLVVAVVLAAGGLGAMAVWHPLGRWIALAIVLLAVVAAGIVYRLRPSAFPWHDDAAQHERRTREAAEH